MNQTKPKIKAVNERERSANTDHDLKNDDIDALLTRYGVAVEPEKSDLHLNERLTRMQQRVLNQQKHNEPSKSSKTAFVLWLMGCLLLVGCLGAQYAVFNMNELIKDPSSRGKLTIVCKVVGCHLPSIDLNNIRISKVRYKPSVGASDVETDIIASIVKVNNITQLYPHLKVTIEGRNDAGKKGILGQFIAEPKDYLIADQQIEMAIPETFFMLTVPLNTDKITKIDIVPFY